MDSGCVGNAHIIKNEEMIIKREPMKYKVVGFNKSTTTSNTVGEVKNIGRSVCVKDAPNNLINLIKLCKDIGGYYNGNEKEMKIYDKNKNLYAHAKIDNEGFLSFKYGDIYPNEIKANPAQPQEIDNYFSNEEKLRAKQAFNLCKQLGHPGDRSLITSLDNNNFSNCILTSKDLKNARKLFGSCPECLLAKMKAPSDKTSTTPPAELIGEKLFMDLIFYGHETIGGNVGAVFSVDEKSSYCWIAGFKNKEKKTINESILKIINHFNQYGHKVKHIVFDDENVLRAQSSMLNIIGIRTTHTPAGLHNKRAERYIQTFKQRFEATKLSCEYILPGKLDHLLAQFIIDRMNAGSNLVTGNSNPFQVVTGLKPSVPLWIWGQSGIFHSPRENTHEKGEWGFYVGHEHATPNHLLAWIPHHKGTYSRRKFVPHSAIPKGWEMKRRHNPVLVGKDSVEQHSEFRRVIIPHNSNKVIQNIPNIPNDPLETLKSSPYRKGEEDIQHMQSDNVEDSRLNQEPVGERIETGMEIERIVVDSPTKEKGNSSSGDINSSTQSNPISQEKISEVKEKTQSDLPTQTEVQSHKAVDQLTPSPQKQLESTTRMRLPRAAKQKTFHDGPVKLRSNKDEEKVHVNRVSLQEALRDKGNVTLTREAINTEIHNLFNNQAITPVHKQEIDGDVVNVLLFFVDKFDSMGNFIKKKGRAAIRGDQENPENIGRTDSPTVIPGSLNTLLALAASETESLIEAYDIVAAFLGTPMRRGKRLFVKFDRLVVKFIVDLYPHCNDFIAADGCLYCLLEKYVYGLSEASREFHLRLDNVLKQIGFLPTVADPCVYQKNTKWGTHRICTHVDDIFSNSPSLQARIKFEDALKKEFEIKGAYDKISYLGMTIEKDKTGIKVSQEGYVDNIITKYKDQINNRIINTPSVASLTSRDENRTTMKGKTQYASLIMGLMYLARFTRPDILFTVTYLATKCQSPTDEDYAKGLRVIQYLSHHPHKHLQYNAGQAKIEVYCDASHLLHEDGKGHSGAVVMFAGNHIYSQSSKQKIQARSSTEAELIALDDITTYVVWLRHLLHELGINQSKASTIYQDNISGMEIIEGGGQFKRTKHMVGKHGYVRDQIRNNIIELIYKKTRDMIADLHTKPMNEEQLRRHCDSIKLYLSKEKS